MSNNRVPWSKREENILKKFYPSTANKTLLKFLDNKTMKNLDNKVYRMGLKKLPECRKKIAYDANEYRRVKEGVMVKYKNRNLIKLPEHYRANNSGFVPEEVLIMEKILNRPLYDNEIIMHKNNDSKDNRPENLYIRINKQYKEGMSRQFKDIDPEELLTLRKNGETVDSLCAKFSISYTTFYRKLKMAKK